MSSAPSRRKPGGALPFSRSRDIPALKSGRRESNCFLLTERKYSLLSYWETDGNTESTMFAGQSQANMPTGNAGKVQFSTLRGLWDQHGSVPGNQIIPEWEKKIQSVSGEAPPEPRWAPRRRGRGGATPTKGQRGRVHYSAPRSRRSFSPSIRPDVPFVSSRVDLWSRGLRGRPEPGPGSAPAGTSSVAQLALASAGS